MKIRVSGFIFASILSLLIISCKSGSERMAGLAPNAHQVKAEEVIQTSAYTYVRAMEDGKDYWLAINSMDVKTGETYFWSRGAEMKEFTSKELKRTFRSIFFVEDFTAEPITLAKRDQNLLKLSQASKKAPVQQEGINVQKLPGGITIAELYSKRKDFEGKPVKIRAQVVKFSPGIMNKNFLHIQDGTADGDKFDLTVTTQDTVKFNDVVTVEGKVTLNRDFGAGYFYEVIIEDAKVKK